MNGASLWQARLCLVGAAVFWSISSAFMRLLSAPLGLGLEEPRLTPLQIAFFRSLFGGLLVLMMVRRAQMRFHPSMVGMVLTFTLMSGLYLTALSLGPAANAIFLKYTAPMWVCLLSMWILREAADWRGVQAVILSAIGAGVIVAGGWPTEMPETQSRETIIVLLMAVASSWTYAGVILFLRALRQYASTWLVSVNLLGTAITLAMFVWLRDGTAGFVGWVTTPTAKQFVVLFAFGLLQMALPYWLFTYALRIVPAAEAALIVLIEPLLNPLWAYLLTPETDTPTPAMIVGGSLILLAIVWRYRP